MSLEPRELWPLFLGLVFLLMGLSLIADADAHAASALEWQRETQPAAAPSSAAGVLWAYRAFGAGFSGVGLWLLVGWCFFRAALLERLGPAVAGPASSPAAGAALAFGGAGLALFKTTSWLRPRSHAFVEEELPLERAPLGRRVAVWSMRLLAALLFSFGTLLISRRPV